MIRTDFTMFKVPPRVPVRVVLNNMTLSVFQTPDFNDVLWSSQLSTLAISNYDDDEGCF